MATTTISIEISASVDQVWQLMGGFDSLPDWLPFIPKSMVSEGGRVRTLTTSDGGTVIERLEAFDYLSTIAVVATADNNITRVEWSGSFTPVNVSDADAEALFSGIYRDGLQALKNNFSA